MGKALRVDDKKVLSDYSGLSGMRKKEAADFISYLRAKDEIEATKEIVTDKDLLESVMRGEADFRAGRYKKWARIKKDV